MVQAIKSVPERLKESMTILRKIQTLGIPSSDSSYKELSGHFNTWIKDGPAYEGVVEFRMWNRKAVLHLPVKAGVVARCDFLSHFY
jgi:hypothetical protein